MVDNTAPITDPMAIKVATSAVVKRMVNSSLNGASFILQHVAERSDLIGPDPETEQQHERHPGEVPPVLAKITGKYRMRKTLAERPAAGHLV